MRSLLMAAFDQPPDTPAEVLSLGAGLARPLLWPALRFGLLLFGTVVVIQLLSTQFGIAPSRLAPDLSRLNSLSRLGQMPAQNAGQAAMALVALPLLGYLAAQLLAEHGPDFHRLSSASLQSAAGRIAAAVCDVLWQGSLLLLALGLFDYYRRRSQWESEMKMSRQEVRDESKESEGNPQIKARIRRLMRERSRRQMMKDVETATAVVVNPTHYAVALRYDAAAMPAPKVVAMGKNYLALRIRERAVKHEVPIVENPPLARALYQSSRVGQEIPAHLFRAVAEVLAYIYRVMNRSRGGR